MFLRYVTLLLMLNCPHLYSMDIHAGELPYPGELRNGHFMELGSGFRSLATQDVLNYQNFGARRINTTHKNKTVFADRQKIVDTLEMILLIHFKNNQALERNNNHQ